MPVNALLPVRRACAVVALVSIAIGARFATAESETAAPADNVHAELHIGDPAPKLSVGKWFKGAPVESFEKGKVYVVEYWATWCPSCVASIPEVTELQKKFKDKATIISLSIESDPAMVDAFVQKQGDKMGYTVGIDEPDGADGAGKSAKAWMMAAGQQGIPCTFIVNQESKVAWIGDPSTLERPLGLIIEGKFDPKQEAEYQSKVKEIEKKFVGAAEAGEWDKAISVIDEMVAIKPSFAERAPLVKLSVMMKKKDFDAVNKEAARLAGDTFKDNPEAQGEIAGVLLEAADAGKGDLDLAMKLAEKAYTAKPDDLNAMKVAALAYAAGKKFDKAVEVQSKLVEKLDGRTKIGEQQVLDEYKGKVGGGEKK